MKVLYFLSCVYASVLVKRNETASVNTEETIISSTLGIVTITENPVILTLSIPEETNVVTLFGTSTTEDVSTTTEDVSTTTEDVSTTTEDVSTTTKDVSTTTTETFVVFTITTTTSEAPEATGNNTIIINNEQNFCESIGLGDVIINGTQSKNVSCSLTVFGAIPDFDHMVSTIIIEPENNAIIPLGENFTVTILSTNIDYGFFDDPNSQYYQSPQTINSQGNIQGHNHITIQKIVDPLLPPDARTPVFFKGLNEDTLDGKLSTTVDSQLFNVDGVGEYRICTITASRSHAPVLLPVARRGSADDCIRINIV
jgi:hypothetical protein